MAVTETSHHHRSSLKQRNKVFKGTTAAKRAENRGKLFKNAVASKNKSKAHIKSKADRINQTAQRMETKREELLKEAKIYNGVNGLPRIVALVPLTASADLHQVSKFVLRDCQARTIYSERHKRSITVLPEAARTADNSLLAVIDQCSQADTVMFVMDGREDLDEWGLAAIQSIRANGVSSAMSIITFADGVKRKQVESVWKDFFKVELALVESIFALGPNDEGKWDSFFFQLSNLSLRGLSWRDLRPYMIIDQVDRVSETACRVYGHLRGHSFASANQLVCIPGIGSFQIDQMKLINKNASKTGVQVDDVVSVPDNQQQQVMYFSMTNMEAELQQDNSFEEMKIVAECDASKVVVPKGTSGYQAAWIAEEGSDECDNETSSMHDEEEMVSDMDEDESEMEQVCADNEKKVSFAEDTEMTNEHLMEHRLTKSKHFVDEIDLDEQISARQRLKKYRAVKSMRTSEWNAYEGLPVEYGKIFAFQNYRLSRKLALLQKPSPFTFGAYVCVDINVPVSSDLCAGKSAYFCLNHEQRMTVVNASVQRARNDSSLILSKERFFVVAGMHRLWVEPIFSEYSNHSLHKFHRELPLDGIHAASFYFPVLYDPCPVMLYRVVNGSLQLALHGSVFSNDPNRVILKRITLTGTPFKIHKRIVVVRFMFFNPADISYFKPVELITKCNRRGHIKESLGTHGYMKCLFDKQIQHHDSVFMHLFKRVFPKWTMESIYYQ